MTDASPSPTPAEIEAALASVERARGYMTQLAKDFNAPNFTDRHADGPRAEASAVNLEFAVATLRRALAARPEPNEDSARLDWTLGNGFNTAFSRVESIISAWYKAHPHGAVVTPESIRAAIDAARKPA